MTISLELNGLKCINPNHRKDAEQVLNHRVIDDYTMNAFFDQSAGKVSLKCYWCNYESIVDIKIRPLQVKTFSGEFYTFR